MRRVPADLEVKLRQRIQTKAADADPALDLWLGRPTTTLTTDTFLERQTVNVGQGVSGVSVAACHPRVGAGSTQLYMAYVQNGTAKVVTAAAKARMDAHAWVVCKFAEPATAAAVAFDGTMPEDTAGRIEFITEPKPWVFWVRSGALYGRVLDTVGEVRLADSNCTAVSAIRGMWSDVGGFDFGLVVFFLLSGAIYYRQLINGVWADAVPVSFGPAGAAWVELAAFRTWDYRVGVQARTASGEVYELFTQFAGIAKKNAEHIDLTAVAAKGTMTAIRDVPAREWEHLELNGVRAGALYGGLYSALPPELLSARNVDDGGGDWGKTLLVTVDVHLEAASVAANARAWRVTDAYGVKYTASTAALGPDGKTVTLGFADFNAAAGACMASYTPGAAVTMAGTALVETGVAFTPQHLVPPQVDPPAPAELRNDGEEGERIEIQFTEALIGEVADCPPETFTVTMETYDYVPGGTRRTVARTVTAVSAHPERADTLVLTVRPGSGNSIQNALGEVTVAYAGGSLVGLGGAVAEFSRSFTPDGLVQKPDQNDVEHIDIRGVEAVGNLVRIDNRETGGNEHIELTVTAAGELIDIDDL